jgi:NADH:ubiquinone oxidoreductase subunit E
MRRKKIRMEMAREYITDKYSPDMENLLLILIEIQENRSEHYIRDEDMVWVAEYLNTTLSSVYGVVKY